MNSFGKIFRVSIFGESHGIQVGAVIDGCPAGLPLSEADLEKELERRKAGAKGTTPRKEADKPKIVSGVFNGQTTGAPITILFENTNTRSRDYTKLRETPRPGHADFTAGVKYGGYEDYRGGGHFSGRITLGLVSAGAIAKKLLQNINITSKIVEVGGNSNIEEAIEKAIANEDSIGGIIECRATGIPVGLGEPWFDKAEAVLAHMVFAIPAIKGLEFGKGFESAKMTGSEHNDNYVALDGTTETNNAGGLNGGITSGNELILRVVVKPTSSTHKTQRTLNFKSNEMVDLSVDGRHDTCIALRVPVVLESATAVVLTDLMLQAQKLPRVLPNSENK
jgi:chorismate synthase